MTLRNLTRTVCFGVILPFVVIVLGVITGRINFLGGEGMLLLLPSYVLFTVSGLVTVVAGLRLRARTQGRERTQLMLLLLVGGAPIWLMIGGLLLPLADWIYRAL